MGERGVNQEQFVLNALSWALSHLAEFHPLQEGLPFDIVRGQRMSELATMAYCYVGLGGDPDGPAIRQIIDFLDELQRDRRLADRALRMPSEFVLFSDVYGSLRALKREYPPLGELLQRALDAGLPQRMERPPHRLMDVGLTLELGGLRHSWPAMESLYPQSIAAGLDSAHYLDEAALYALTHVIMFLFGFGTRPSPALTGQDRARLAPVLADLLICMCQEQHWDLLTELLICWDCLDLAPTPLVEGAWSALLAKQRPDGAVPGPVEALRLYELSGRHPDPETDPALDFAYHYHTTLLAIIAGTLHRQRASLRTAVTASMAGNCGTGDASAATLAIQATQSWLHEVLAALPGDSSAAPAALCAIALGQWICLASAPADAQRGQAAGRHRSLRHAAEGCRSR